MKLKHEVKGPKSNLMFFTNKNFIFIQRSIGVWVVTANNEAFEPEYLYMRIEEERRETA